MKSAVTNVLADLFGCVFEVDKLFKDLILKTFGKAAVDARDFGLHPDKFVPRLAHARFFKVEIREALLRELFEGVCILCRDLCPRLDEL